MLKKIAFSALLSMVVVFTTVEGQVVQCTDGGCTQFALECRDGGGDVVCYNALSNVQPTSKQVRTCEHWKHMTDWLCNRDLPAKKPCLNAEKKMLQECTYLPITVCVTDPNTIPELLQANPNICMGDCTEVLDKLKAGVQPICGTDFQ